MKGIYMKRMDLLRNSSNASLFLLIALFFAGCSGNQQHNQQAKSWKTQQIVKSEVLLKSRYSASIQGKQDIEIRPRISGTIILVNITEGERVAKGQTLFVIDQVPYKAALARASANVKAAEAIYATAKLNFQSKQRMLAGKVISEHEFLTAQNEQLRAEAELAQAQASEVSARNDLSYTEVKSPANGVVSVLPYRQGALVSSAIAQPLTTISDNSEMYVYFSMGESQVLSLMRQWGAMDEAIKNIDDVDLQLSDGTLYAEKGKVESISGVIDRNTGSVTLRAKFTNEKKMLLSGSSGNVLIPVLHRDVILIPQSATAKIQDKYLVYTAVNGKAKSTPVTIAGDNDGKQYIVLSGLEVNDVIIADGAGLVREGMDITMEDQADEK